MYAGSLECVDLLLAAGGDIHASDQVDADVAQHHRDPEILDRLQAAGATVHPSQGSTGSLLHSAAEDGDLGLLEYLLRQQADVNFSDLCGRTPLMAAAERGHADVIRRLLAAGANVHACDQDGRTALFYSAAPEAFTAFQLTQEFSGEDATNAMYKALGEVPDDMKYLLEQLTPSLNYGYDPSDDVIGIDLLLSAGAKIEDRDEEGATSLLVACRCGRPARVTMLIQMGANVHARDATGRSARDLPAEHHDTEQRDQILRLLEETE
jgi:ankyrin repeat protein